MGDLFRDVRHALRVMGRNPAFSLVALGTLAFGIAATVTVFSIVDAWLFKPLNFPHAEQLTMTVYATRERPAEPAVFALFRDFLAWKERSRSFSSMAAAFPRTYLLGGTSEATTADGLVVSADFFRTLGVPAQLGRTPSDADANGPAVAVLSYGLWQRQFGASPGVLGRSITLNGVPHQIVGVMPREFDVRLLERTTGFELWTLFAPGEPGYGPGGTGGVAVIGRLRPGIDALTAQRELTEIHERSERAYARNLAQFGVLVASLQADNTRMVRSTLMVVSAAVGGLLLIACMNVGTLLLGQALGRSREAAIRMAIGSGYARLVRQFVVESAVLSALGGASGVALAAVALRLFTAWNPLGTLPAAGIAIDWRALVCAAGAMTAAAVLCGLAPALRAARTDPNDALRSGASRGASAAGQRAQTILLAAQIAASVVLLVATGLLVRSFVRLYSEPLGFDASRMTIVSTALPLDEFDSAEKRLAFATRMAGELKARTGVHDVAAGTSALLSSGAPVTVHTRADDSEPPLRIGVEDVTANFFDALSIQLIAGRPFDVRDAAASPPVVVVNESAARLLFGAAADAPGRRLRIGDEPFREVVGVVANTRTTFFNTLEWVTKPALYVPAAQGFRVVRNPTIRSFALHFYVRADRPVAMVEAKSVAAKLSPSVAVIDAAPGSVVVAAATRQPAFRMWLLGWFAAASLALAAIGIYGLVSQGILQRTREIGIRLALGATPGRVRFVVVRGALATALGGSAVGCAAAFALGGTLQAVLYGVRATDAWSYLTALALLIAAVAAAALAAAIAATRINPIDALRRE